jgi:hypothetical protein
MWDARGSARIDNLGNSLMKILKTLAAAVAFAASTAAYGTVILPGPETPLQDVINGLYYDPVNCPSCSPISAAPNVQTEQYGLDQLWAIEASNGSLATLVLELAGNAATNSFGIYDAVNGNKVTLFGGAAGSPDQVKVSISTTGRVRTVFEERDANGDPVGEPITWTSSSGYFTGNVFGYFLQTQSNGTFYSQTSKNADQADQMVAFKGDGDHINIPGSWQGAVWGSSSYILAWEDVAYNASDKDFNDFIVYVESITGVPEPGVLAVLAAGLLGLGFTMRRRVK